MQSKLDHSQSGFALIEVLVTSVIFAIGISGMGVLLLKTIQATQDNAQRSQGMWVVQDFVGRIRANPEGAKAGGYVTTGVDCGTDRPATSAMCADHVINNVKVAGANCSPADMAAFDVWVTMCGFDDPTPTDPNDKIFDSPAEFLVNSVLTSTCDVAAGCVQYSVNLTWSSKITKGDSDEAKRINENNYSMIVELN